MAVLITLGIAVIVALIWVYLIEKAHDEAPNYKGHDLFGTIDEDDIN
jgi:hypothetical protein